MKILVILATALILSGCSTVKIAAKHATDHYCATPEPLRLTLRREFEIATFPNSIKITCELVTR